MGGYLVTFVTVPNEEEGREIARTLVEERLAACVNLVPLIRSFYHWEGKLCEEPEALMIIKTKRELYASLEEKVKGLHSYSVPEVISWTIEEGSEDYLNWLNMVTQ